MKAWHAVFVRTSGGCPGGCQPAAGPGGRDQAASTALLIPFAPQSFQRPTVNLAATVAVIVTATIPLLSFDRYWYRYRHQRRQRERETGPNIFLLLGKSVPSSRDPALCQSKYVRRKIKEAEQRSG